MIKFGTDGWRAKISDEFTFDNVKIVALGISNYLKKKNVASKGLVIGYDNRFQSEDFAKTCALVASGAGIKTYLVDHSCTTPALSYSVKSFEAGGGIMVTASHNPPEYNGIKFKADYAGSASPKITEAIEQEISAILRSFGSVILQSGELISYFNPREKYFEHIKKLVDLDLVRKQKIRVIVDPMHGSASGYLSEILKRIAEVREINKNRDPLFSGIRPEPLPVNLEDLISEVKDESLKYPASFVCGIALDGDGDRIAAVDGSGRFINSHNIFSLILKHLFENKNLRGSVVKAFNVSFMVDKQAKDYGLKLYETSIGFKYICDLMLKEDILIGGEESGGFGIKGSIPERDGVLSALILLEAVAAAGKSFGVLLGELMQKYGSYFYDRVDVLLDEKVKVKILQKLKEAPPKTFGRKKVVQVKDLDGMKFILEDESWILFRASGTEPLLRIYVEGRSDDDVKQILSDGEKFIRSV
ncbi:MAG: phosphoglucomutase/phosphomannomutase family protein [Candidatus Saganbacteria bacterium]|nr:phosphoglucomutase/phosphomannomutase family protein [Candidatus Saganbacteria bacterium]